ncbi:MAG: DUF1805 domain-containing protein [Promethearchaeota archaeon]
MKFRGVKVKNKKVRVKISGYNGKWNEIKEISDKILGVSCSWPEGQLVFILSRRGIIACGAIDAEVLDKFNFAVTVSEGTVEKPLVTPDDLLKAKVMKLTKKAKELGIKIGMSGKEALEKLV